MVETKVSRQKHILGEQEDPANANRAFLIGASFILDVASRTVEILTSKTVFKQNLSLNRF